MLHLCVILLSNFLNKILMSLNGKIDSLIATVDSIEGLRGDVKSESEKLQRFRFVEGIGYMDGLVLSACDSALAKLDSVIEDSHRNFVDNDYGIDIPLGLVESLDSAGTSVSDLMMLCLKKYVSMKKTELTEFFDGFDEELFLKRISQVGVLITPAIRSAIEERETLRKHVFACEILIDSEILSDIAYDLFPGIKNYLESISTYVVLMRNRNVLMANRAGLIEVFTKTEEEVASMIENVSLKLDKALREDPYVEASLSFENVKELFEEFLSSSDSDIAMISALKSIEGRLEEFQNESFAKDFLFMVLQKLVTLGDQANWNQEKIMFFFESIREIFPDYISVVDEVKEYLREISFSIEIRRLVEEGYGLSELTKMINTPGGRFWSK